MNPMLHHALVGIAFSLPLGAAFLWLAWRIGHRQKEDSMTRFRTFRGLVVLLASLATLIGTATTASAAPLMFPEVSTTGMWRPAAAPGNDGTMPFSNASYDGAYANLGYLLANNGLAIDGGTLEGFEYLWAPARLGHEWDGVEWELAAHHTAYANATMTRGPLGSFILDVPEEGATHDSGGLGWNQFVWLRRWVAEDAAGRWAQMFVGEEDMRDGDWDFNDIVLMALVFVPFDVPPPPCFGPACGDDPPSKVPEPAAMALFGMGLLGAAARAKRRFA